MIDEQITILNNFEKSQREVTLCSSAENFCCRVLSFLLVEFDRTS